MLNFLVHLCVLLSELLGICVSGKDVLLHLLDLVIQYEFEFFKLLCRHSQVTDPSSLLFQSLVTFFDFFLL